MITNELLSEALDYLKDTDEDAANLKADVERKEWLFKRAKALTFKLAEGTVADRNAEAEISEEVKQAATDWFKAIELSEKVRAKRQTKALIVEVWRTISANQRKGNI